MLTHHTAVPRRGIVALLLTTTLTGLAACRHSPEASDQPPRRLRIATGDDSGVYHLLGRRLAEIYNRRLPRVQASVLETTGSGFNVRAVEEGTAELAFSQADVAYLATQQGPRDHPQPYRRLRTVAALYENAVQIVTFADSGVSGLDDLVGRRVGVGAPDSGTELAARAILASKNLEHRVVAEALGFDELASRIERRLVDAGFFVSSYPLPAIARLNALTSVRLLSIDEPVTLRIRGEYPFLRPTVIPASAYAGQPTHVATVGVDNLLICSSELPAPLVYQLTRALIEALPELASAHAAAATITLEQARSAVIPLHEGAAHYYRERELFR